MIIVATSIKLNHWAWVPFFVVLSVFMRLLLFFRPTLKLLKFHRTSEGSWLTLSAWQNAPSMLSFRNKGLHLMAMKLTPLMLKEGQTARWQSDQLPSWPEALEKLSQAEIYTNVAS
jgi:hypothetical protein